MGGSVGKSFDPTGGSFLGLNNIPKVGGVLSRVGGDVATGGLAEFARKDPFIGLATNSGSGIPSIYGSGTDNPGISGPFSLDPALLAADQGNINQTGQQESDAQKALAQSQYDQTQNFITGDAADRATARQKLSDVLTANANTMLARSTPGIEEKLNAQGLLNGSGLGQELGRQQGYAAEDIASQIGQLGASDIYNQSAQKQAALAGLLTGQQGALSTQQGFQTGSLQRGLSLEDQINNANISKSIGQAFAPQPPSGKAQFGTAAQGVGALAPWAYVGKAGAKAAPLAGIA